MLGYFILLLDGPANWYLPNVVRERFVSQLTDAEMANFPFNQVAISSSFPPQTLRVSKKGVFPKCMAEDTGGKARQEGRWHLGLQTFLPSRERRSL